jgi:hypothetical protein
MKSLLMTITANSPVGDINGHDVLPAIRNVHALLGTLIHENGFCGIMPVSP